MLYEEKVHKVSHKSGASFNVTTLVIADDHEEQKTMSSNLRNDYPAEDGYTIECTETKLVSF